MLLVASLFNQLLQHFPRTEFAALVDKHKAEYGAKGFSCLRSRLRVNLSLSQDKLAGKNGAFSQCLVGPV